MEEIALLSQVCSDSNTGGHCPFDAILSCIRSQAPHSPMYILAPDFFPCERVFKVFIRFPKLWARKFVLKTSTEW